MKKNKRSKRSNKELINISNHLLYEIKMLFGTALATRTVKIEKKDDIRSWAICNSLIESFTVHARILLDFLYSRGAKSDDVIAEDFFDNPAVWITQRPAKSILLKTIHRRVGKEVAHLTYARLAVTPVKKQWQYVKIANEIGLILKKFLQLVPRFKVSQFFSEFISQNIKK